MKQVINVSELTERSVLRAVLDTYAVRTDRPAVWLQRALCWVLGKIGAYALTSDITVQRHEVDTKDFFDRLVRQHRMLQRLDIRPKEVLMGPEDYAELSGDSRACLFRPFGFTTVYGLKIRVIPWMRGVLVVPE